MQADSADKAKIIKFLSQNHTGTLSVVGTDNKAHGSTVYFAVDDEINFHFITKTGTRKYQGLMANPNVAITVTNTDTETTVQVEGKASEVKDLEQQSEIMEKIASPHKDSKGVWVPPIAEINAGAFVILTVQPDFLRYADFGRDETETIEL